MLRVALDSNLLAGSTTLLTILQAIEHYTFIAADGVEMPLEEGTSGFITMNPGYIGRAELPESLKVSSTQLWQVQSLCHCTLAIGGTILPYLKNLAHPCSVF